MLLSAVCDGSSSLMLAAITLPNIFWSPEPVGGVTVAVPPRAVTPLSCVHSTQLSSLCVIISCRVVQHSFCHL